MILIDYSQVILATLFVSIGNHTDSAIDEDNIRAMFLNSLRYNRKKFNQEFGEVVLCVDSRNSWRRKIFPYYKANRKKSREESELDWAELFRIMHMLREEIAEHFPYKVLIVDECEADDIIGTICHAHGKQLGGDKILILSGDKDYIQLQKYANISQYNPVLKKWVQNSNPDKYIMEHILKGDGSDGVPNVLSPDNAIVIGERQKSLTAKRMEDLLRGPEFMDEITKSRYLRNKKMIDLSEVPDHHKETILEEYNKEKTIGRSKLFKYFLSKQLKYLLTDIGDF